MSVTFSVSGFFFYFIQWPASFLPVTGDPIVLFQEEQENIVELLTQHNGPTVPVVRKHTQMDLY